jgi:hypothetical protein
MQVKEYYNDDKKRWFSELNKSRIVGRQPKILLLIPQNCNQIIVGPNSYSIECIFGMSCRLAKGSKLSLEEELCTSHFPTGCI